MIGNEEWNADLDVTEYVGLNYILNEDRKISILDVALIAQNYNLKINDSMWIVDMT